MPMPLIVWVTTNWKILKEMEIPDHLICSSEICMQVKKQQLELDMEQQTDFKLGNEYIKAIYCHPAYLAYMQTTSCKMLGCMKLRKESRLLEEISVTSDMQITHPYSRKGRTKEPLDESERGERKGWPKSQQSEN